MEPAALLRTFRTRMFTCRRVTYSLADCHEYLHHVRWNTTWVPVAHVQCAMLKNALLARASDYHDQAYADSSSLSWIS